MLSYCGYLGRNERKGSTCLVKNHSTWRVKHCVKSGKMKVRSHPTMKAAMKMSPSPVRYGLYQFLSFNTIHLQHRIQVPGVLVDLSTTSSASFTCFSRMTYRNNSGDQHMQWKSSALSHFSSIPFEWLHAKMDLSNILKNI